LYVSLRTKPAIVSFSVEPSSWNTSPTRNPASFSDSLTIAWAGRSDDNPSPSITPGSRKLPGSIPMMAMSTFSSSEAPFSFSADDRMIPIGDAACTSGRPRSSSARSPDSKDLAVDALDPCSNTT